MPKKHRPRRGSLAYSPRKRAKKPVATIKNYPSVEKPKVMGFAGYKAGMTHVIMLDDVPHSMTEGREIPVPVTVLETPPLKVVGIRIYKYTDYGKKCLAKGKEDGDEVCVLLATKPEVASGVPKKKPELMECRVGGNFKESLAYAKSLAGKEILITDVFSEGETVDVAAVSKGKGTEGPVKRWGVMIQPAKAQRSSRGRHVGSLGPWHPAHVSWRVPQLGQMGYHQRTEYNKRILKIGADGKEITPNGGFIRYGIVRNSYILIKGSIPGPAKRLIRLRPMIRGVAEKPRVPKITYISTESKQGL